MAEIHNGIKYDTGVLEACATGAGLGRDQGGVERLGETLTPIANPYDIPEWQLLRKNWFAALDGSQAAVVAEFSCVALINPAGSNMIAVVNAVTCRMITTASALALEVTSEAVIRAALAGAETRGLYRDRRRNQLNTRCSVLVGSEATAVGGEIEQVAPVAGITAPFVTSLPLILPPGQGIVIRGGTVNLAMMANFGWTERFALPGELAAT